MNQDNDMNDLPLDFGKLSVRKIRRKDQLNSDLSLPNASLESIPKPENITQPEIIIKTESQTTVNVGVLSKQPSLNSQALDIEETKEPQVSQIPKRFTQRKRKIDAEMSHELKMVKQILNDTQPKKQDSEKVTVVFKTQRRYSQQAKTKILDLAEKLGPYKVSNQTGVPEATIRRWKKVGTGQKTISGRNPLYPESRVGQIF